MDVLAHVTGKARAAKEAARALALASTRAKNEALQQMARGLEEKIALLLDANRSDMARARSAGLASAFMDRLTLSESRTSGPAELLQGADAPLDLDSSLDGRLAFYLNSKFGEHWHVTASADTREGPVEDLFSNFLDKSPDSLFRRIDPDNHYPTFGDDGVVDETAPTMGKLYLKLNQGENYGLWGNFTVGYMGNELAQVDRGLYGVNGHYAS